MVSCFCSYFCKLPKFWQLFLYSLYLYYSDITFYMKCFVLSYSIDVVSTVSYQVDLQQFRTIAWYNLVNLVQDNALLRLFHSTIARKMQNSDLHIAGTKQLKIGLNELYIRLRWFSAICKVHELSWMGTTYFLWIHVPISNKKGKGYSFLNLM